jgi:hypothetical protein
MHPAILYEGPRGTLFVLEVRHCIFFSHDREVLVPTEDLAALFVYLFEHGVFSKAFLQFHQVLRLAAALSDRRGDHG